MRIGAIVVVIWLVVGVIAAAERNYFSNSRTNCAELGNIVVTVIAGPLNYLGVNAKVRCHAREP
jgi:hypothetical protein